MKKKFLMILILGVVVISVMRAKIKTGPDDPNPEDVGTLSAPSISSADFNQNELI